MRGATTLGSARGMSTSVGGVGLRVSAASLVLVLGCLLLLLLLRLVLLAISGALHLDTLVAVALVACRGVGRAGHAKGLILVVVVVVEALRRGA